jgi:hypothetical protein
MYLTFRFPDGHSLEGILLAIGRSKMRVGIPGQPDTLEFELVDGCWTAENGERIELECLIRTSSAGLPAAPRAASASGNSCSA